ncbi:LuxR C-terminal-related transcriptional regulator [uncultured Sphingomonas sp.]|uniref:helix-turn-helix transcriptional regulator n=1 Tax=uncultured Sphingomonas sp. TaxID=158754 RepID=UPI0035CBF102
MAVAIRRTKFFDGWNVDQAKLIDALGESTFGPVLLATTRNLCGAEHLALYDLCEDAPVALATASPCAAATASQQASLYVSGGYWRCDPLLAQIGRLELGDPAMIARLDPEHLAATDLRDTIYRPHNVVGRLVLGARLRSGPVALSLIRTRRRGPFSPADAVSLQDVASDLIHLLGKHVALRRSLGSAAASLRSLAVIEREIAASRHCLSRREAQVSARILYGMTTVGIALDLEIGQESVATYRRRGYDRLGIASQRELLLWYLDRWSASQAEAETEPVYRARADQAVGIRNHHPYRHG